MKKIRRYDLDWLRVGVFALLILYHVGMFFVPWGWHVKNNENYTWLRWPMLFLNQWRLPILFIISGMGTYYALSYRSWWQFNLERHKRLLIPLIFGMLVIVPPQIYFERLANAEFLGTYGEFLTSQAYVGIYPEGNFSWHHLWFLPYLLLFSVILAPIFIRLKRKPSKLLLWTQRMLTKPLGLYLFVIPLYFIEALVEPFFPVTHALIGDWFTISFNIVLFFFGFLLIASGKVWWDSVDRIKTRALYVGIVAFSVQVLIWQGEDSIWVHFTEAFVKVVNLWSWILVLFGYGARFLNRKSKLLSYCNQAVYPFYILHQTITVMLGYYIKEYDWGLFVKFSILTIGTFLGSWLIYHFILLKVPLIQPLFGLKKRI